MDDAIPFAALFALFAFLLYPQRELVAFVLVFAAVLVVLFRGVELVGGGGTKAE